MPSPKDLYHMSLESYIVFPDYLPLPISHINNLLPLSLLLLVHIPILLRNPSRICVLLLIGDSLIYHHNSNMDTLRLIYFREVTSQVELSGFVKGEREVRRSGVLVDSTTCDNKGRLRVGNRLP